METKSYRSAAEFLENGLWSRLSRLLGLRDSFADDDDASEESNPITLIETIAENRRLREENHRMRMALICARGVLAKDLMRISKAYDIVEESLEKL